MSLNTQTIFTEWKQNNLVSPELHPNLQFKSINWENLSKLQEYAQDVLETQNKELKRKLEQYEDHSFTAELLQEAEEEGDQALEDYVKEKVDDAIMNEDIYSREDYVDKCDELADLQEKLDELRKEKHKYFQYLKDKDLECETLREANEKLQAVDNKCCLCGGDYGKYGNNPYPLNKTDGAKCCNDCNGNVIMARITQACS